MTGTVQEKKRREKIQRLDGVSTEDREQDLEEQRLSLWTLLCLTATRKFLGICRDFACRS